MHNDVEIEPALQEITNEKIPGNTNNEIRPDIRARGCGDQDRMHFLIFV